MTKRTRALLLFGGGLDSRLVRALLERAGIDPVSVHFDTGFLTEDRCSSAREGGQSIDVFTDYLATVVLEPKYGYGAAMNPCLDCRIFMLARARRIAEERGIDRIATGEVVGQRAFDQSRRAFALAERESGLTGRIRRPLSDGLLAGRSGDESAVWGPALRIAGSRRREQIDLARELGVAEWPTPTGRCCRLADPAFARRLRDLLAHTDGVPDRRAVELLTRGRHFRLSWDLKLIVARDESEGRWLEQRAGRGWLCRPLDRSGALAWLDGVPSVDRIERVGRFVARYARVAPGETVEIEIRRAAESLRVRVPPATEAELARARV